MTSNNERCADCGGRGYFERESLWHSNVYDCRTCNGTGIMPQIETATDIDEQWSTAMRLDRENVTLKARVAELEAAIHNAMEEIGNPRASSDSFRLSYAALALKQVIK